MVDTKELSSSIFKTPIGCLEVVCCDQTIVSAQWKANQPDRMPKRNLLCSPSRRISLRMAHRIQSQLDEYFLNDSPSFDLDLDLGRTEFQQQVYTALSTVPRGGQITYQELAARMGRPKACRAVGTALARNQILLFIPCHRVIPRNSSKGVGDYAGGAEIKARLLEIERQPSSRGMVDSSYLIP